MIRKSAVLMFLLLIWTTSLTARINIRIFAGEKYSSAVFSVDRGKYRIESFSGEKTETSAGDEFLIALYNDKVVLKLRGRKASVFDSLMIEGETGDDRFSLRINGSGSLRQNYSGSILCKPDLGTLIFINSIDNETYIAGVVRAEAGPGRNLEYSKTQAVIARTYMYRYLDRHVRDGYNLCDNTHCQAFDGITNDSIINRAVRETRDQVILGPDSTLIISAFHSNCGGETSPSEYVWLTGQTYLKKVTDPYCASSPNAVWQKKIPAGEWKAYLYKNGYPGKIDDNMLLNFSQPHRSENYMVGSFQVPLRQIRSDLDLRSAYFSVTAEGDSVKLTGKGYGHGVGLCQEGAKVMAARGFDYRQIIAFYYQGVIVSDIRNAITR